MFRFDKKMKRCRTTKKSWSVSQTSLSRWMPVTPWLLWGRQVAGSLPSCDYTAALHIVAPHGRRSARCRATWREFHPRRDSGLPASFFGTERLVVDEKSSFAMNFYLFSSRKQRGHIYIILNNCLNIF